MVYDEKWKEKNAAIEKKTFYCSHYIEEFYEIIISFMRAAVAWRKNDKLLRHKLKD